MPRAIFFNKGDIAVPLTEVRQIANDARVVAAAQGIKVPKRIEIGTKGRNVYITIATNKICDIITDLIKDEYVIAHTDSEIAKDWLLAGKIPCSHLY
jgi:hypothetical protein